MGDDALKAAQAPCHPEIADAYYTLQEAAEEMGVPVDELHLAIQKGTLPFIHQYSRKLLRPADVAAYAARRAETSPPVQ